VPGSPRRAGQRRPAPPPAVSAAALAQGEHDEQQRHRHYDGEREEVIHMTTASMITSIMLEADVIERVAAEAEVEPDQVERVLETWRTLSGERRFADLIERLMPERLEVPTPAVVLQARRNAEARTALLGEFGALRSADVADLAGSRAANRAALANRWRAENRVVAVPVGDELLYPGFQFTHEGRPHPAVGAALGILRSIPDLSDWQAVLWFVGANGWLGGRRPVDLLDEDPGAVEAAARREVEELVF
jgi:hypothetical protein